MTIESASSGPNTPLTPSASAGAGRGWWTEHWRSVVIVSVIVAAMWWALRPKSRPTVELPPFEQKEQREPEK